MSFRENLREALDFSGLEQKELAHRAGISLNNIESYLRKNGSMPSADKAVKIAQVLGTTVEALVTGKDLPAEAVSKDLETQKLVQSIKKLPKSKQNIIFQNAVHLTKILSQ